MKTFILRNDGNLDRIKRGLYLYLEGLDLTKPQQVTISDYKENKTAEQRKTFHLLCKLFGDETGYSLNEIKELVKGELLETTVVTIAGREREVTRSTESLKRDEYSRLIDETYRLASEAGIVLPVLSRYL